MKDWELEVLKVTCLKTDECKDCPKDVRENCKKFRRIIKTIEKPYELYRLTEHQWGE